MAYAIFLQKLVRIVVYYIFYVKANVNFSIKSFRSHYALNSYKIIILNLSKIIFFCIFQTQFKTKSNIFKTKLAKLKQMT